MTKKELSNLLKIVQENIPELETRTDLKQHFNDEEDFFETSIWSLEAAITAAYELGKKSK